MLVAVIRAAVVVMVILVRTISLVILLLLEMVSLVLILADIALISVVCDYVKSITFVIRSASHFLLRNILTKSSLTILDTFRVARLTLIAIEN